MCGIVGYISKKDNPNALHLGIEALKRLEYRGYDSAGFAFWDEIKKEIQHRKTIGRISKLEEKIKDDVFSSANPLILHTRWATHGGITENNAHPHFDCKKNIFLVHNGIIENYKELKDQLIGEGHKFNSETDTEVLSHLIEKFFKGNLENAVKQALTFVKGTYGIAVISKEDPKKIVAARFSSPLLVGLGEDEFILASDPSAIIAHTKTVVYLRDNEMVTITSEKIDIQELEKRKEQIDWDIAAAQRGGYPHFMLKEIMEQPESIKNSMRGRVLPEEGGARIGGLNEVLEKLREIERIQIVACGTARHAGIVGEYMLEEYAGILTKVDAASEFRYRKSILDKKTAVLAISQSGETADTLAALKEAKSRGILTLGITNVTGSTQARETDAGIYNHAGPEIGVASTKAYTSQLTVLALFALLLGRQRQLSLVMGQRIAKELLRIPELVGEVLKNNEQIKELAEKYKDFNNYLYLGRKYNYATAR
ncbi:MAG: glutamine--fructose-6-phosphate transaminase (isomerizing), partial [Candidatus Nealsonbacteria bacterium]